MLGALFGNIAESRFLLERSEDLSQAGALFDPPAHLTDSGRLFIEFSQLLLDYHSEPDILRSELTAKGYPMLSLTEYGLIGSLAETEDVLERLIEVMAPTEKEVALALAKAVFWAKQGETKETILQRIEQDFFPVFTLEAQVETPQVRALVAFLGSKDSETALWRAIEFSAPGEELASAVGVMARAYYGLNDETERMIRRLVNPKGRKVISLWKSRFPAVDPAAYRLLTKYQHRLENDRELSHFVQEFYYYAMHQAAVDLSRYQELLEAAGLEWTQKTLFEAEADSLADTTVLALIIGALRADYFSPGILEDLVADGAIDRWLKRLAELGSSDKELPALEVIRLTLELIADGTKESIRIDESGLEVKVSIDQTLEQTLQVQVKDRWLMGRLDDILALAGQITAETDWNEQATNQAQPVYQLALELIDGSLWQRSGPYDRAHMPEKPWRHLMERVAEFIHLLGIGRSIGLTDFNRALKPGEVKYCGVEFDDYGKLYHYLTYDMDIQVGDRVIVPAGPANAEKEVTVRTIEFCQWDDTPYPLEETKLILRKLEPEPSFSNRLIRPITEEPDYFPVEFSN